ncbi:hypothetical protein ES677_00120 [Bizionia gelidisalsuginis]|uniref:Arsenate reductase n=2 Tax=Bizionia TaxID=283785 RepID=A0A8H2LGT4_9FLAO|nr:MULTISPECIES: hypothetical protein [Bizionia]TYB77499.1 hypothetical protein ES676_04190 [Bizionia saleffrena]TYC17820.1 hypothetical protein ES677_00120 [Bizionia gelidisalsuginis]
MGTISTNKNMITLFYNSQTALGKQTLPYVTAADKKVHAIDISKTKVTGTQWATIADNLNLSIGDLINNDHPDFTKNYDKTSSFDSEDWIKVLNNNPDTLKCPIIIVDKTYSLLKSPSDFLKHIESDSAGIDGQNPEAL